MPLRRTNASAPSVRDARVAVKPQARILYVEDDDASWAITRRFLGEKFELERATNSDATFSILAGSHFDLILLDIELAGSKYDGITICRMLRERISWREIPIVFVTAYSARYSKETLVEAGANDMVIKPVDYTRLLLLSSRLILGNFVTR